MISLICVIKNWNADTDNTMVVPKGKGGGGVKGKGAKYIMTDDYLILGGWHTMQYTDHVS